MLYLGGYSTPGTRGILVAGVRGGALTVEATVDCAPDPSYLATGPGGRTLYAVHELDEGLVSAFALDGGRPRPIGSRASGGARPCHLSVHPGGRHLLTANYGSGSFAVHPIGSDGALGPASHVVETGTPYAHMVVTDPAGRWVLAVHLGANLVSTYRLDLDAGRLRLEREARLHPRAGPRHLAFHPGGAVVYVVNELDSTVTACAYDAAGGRLDPGPTVRTVPDGVAVDNYPSGIRVSPDGRFVYVANRGHDSVALLATDPAPRLVGTYPCAGRFPRDLVLTGDGRRLYVANEHSGSVDELAVDPAGGGLEPTGVRLRTPKPTCVLPH